MPKILVIEDEAAIRRVLVKILSEENDTYEVSEAEDGLAGIDQIKKEDYDLILCDIKMPKMDGVEVLDRKSTRLNSSHVKISYAVFCLKKKNNTHQHQ